MGYKWFGVHLKACQEICWKKVNKCSILEHFDTDGLYEKVNIELAADHAHKMSHTIWGCCVSVIEKRVALRYKNISSTSVCVWSMFEWRWLALWWRTVRISWPMFGGYTVCILSSIGTTKNISDKVRWWKSSGVILNWSIKGCGKY